MAFSCSSNKYIDPGKPTKHYELVQIPVVLGNDTVSQTEMRIYRITNSLHSMMHLFKAYGKWEKRLEGRYQENIQQLVWENRKIPNVPGTYTIVASGAETATDFFVTIAVFDEKGEDALDSRTTDSQLIRELIAILNMETDSAAFFEKYRH